MVTFTVPQDKNGRIAFSFKTRSGGAAKVQEGSIEVTSSDETVAKVFIREGNILIDTQGPGTATGTLSADADLGAGVTLVSAVFDIIVTALNAESVALGEVVLEDKPAA